MKTIRNLQIKIKRLFQMMGIGDYLHHYGPKTYKFSEHAEALLLMEVCQMSFERIEKFQKMNGKICPTHSALCKSRKRIPVKLWQKLLKLTAGLSSGKVAIDGTGFSKTNPSFHYLKRIDSKNPKNYTKLSALLDLKTKKFLMMRIRTTPRHDMQDVKYLLKRISDVKRFYGDSGYDAEWLHEQCYWSGIQTYIPPRKNVKIKKFRKRQMENWNKKEYNLRSNVESGFSAIKRKYGGAVRAKRIEGMRAEILLKGIAHNLELRI
jgi:transposase